MVFSVYRLSLNFRRKRKRRGSESDFSDMEGGSSHAAKKEEDDANKRRSGRNTSRKKYVDELDLNLSDDDNLFVKNANNPNGAGNNASGDPQSAADLAAAYTGQNPGDEPEANLVKPNFVYVVSHCQKFVFLTLQTFYCRPIYFGKNTEALSPLEAPWQSKVADIR